MYRTLLTFTVAIDIHTWMHSTSDASGALLLSYLTDLSEGLDFRYPVTACKLDSRPTLWFTFMDETDKNLFMDIVEKLWRQGGWLNDSLAS